MFRIENRTNPAMTQMVEGETHHFFFGKDRQPFENSDYFQTDTYPKRLWKRCIPDAAESWDRCEQALASDPYLPKSLLFGVRPQPKETRMFKIVQKEKHSGPWTMAVEEQSDRFIGKTIEKTMHPYDGVEMREEFLKTHWERAPIDEPTWQDVTEGIQVDIGECRLRYHGKFIYAGDPKYRFVRVEAYLPAKYVGELTTLLRVERKAE